jgi:two-component system, LytTR family, sensor kinase
VSTTAAPDASAGRPAAFDRRRLRPFGLLIAAACLVPALLDAWQASLQSSLAGEGAAPWRIVVFQGGEWVILGALTPLVYLLAPRFPLRRPHVARDIAAHVGGALALCVGWASCGIALRAALGILPRDVALGRHAASWVLTSLPWSVFMYFTVLGCVLAFAYFFEAREREAQAARLAAQVTQARLDALRVQLHPHFLFNSLNAVAVLVRDGRAEQAVRVVEQLSDILRELLSGGDEALVSLSREVAFLEKYLDIERTRFPDRLEVRWQVDPAALEALVPSFVLQPLVENALRHGVAARAAPTLVEVRAAIEHDTLVLGVSNDAPEPGEVGATGGRGVGLANMRERLLALYGPAAGVSLDRTGDRVVSTVRIPRRGTSA